jgi:tetratricopeptide (TPR) repeat protein
MHSNRAILLLVLVAVRSMFSVVCAQQPTNLPPKSGPLPKNEAREKAFWVTMVHDYNFATNDITRKMNLQPRYGSLPKNDALKASDAKFLAAMDDEYKGNRKKAAEDMALLGWQFLREQDMDVAMKRFNQAWLLDSSNGTALWGMAVFEAMAGKPDESLKLFAEAERSIGDDINFSVDYAKTMGFAGAYEKNEQLLKDAFARFSRVYEKAPQNTLNLENWAKTLFLVGDYGEAWKKVKLAEATPGGGDLDPRFLESLKSKMPRP